MKLLPVVIRTANEPWKTDCLHSSKEINWHNSSDRKWLTDHMHWAMKEGHDVQLIPVHPTVER